jgi:hypothetical protein
MASRYTRLAQGGGQPEPGEDVAGKRVMAEIGSPSVLLLFRLPRCLRPFAEVIGVAGGALSL